MAFIEWLMRDRERFRKDSPVASDVHVSNAGGSAKPKRKKPKSFKDALDDEGHLPVTNMSLAAQQITGQAKPTQKFAEVLKVDDGLGLVFGWAIISNMDGKAYYDLQSDHIPEDAMLKASTDFMSGARMAKEMHAGDEAGTVLFAFPMTTDIAKAFSVETKTTGLMVAMRPAPDMLAKFKDGTYTGFSIGGYRVRDEEV